MKFGIGRVVAAAAAATLSVLAVPSTPAGATTYYEYWSYWHKPPGATSWQYSSVGPSGYYLQPDKPQVEGWRFAVGTASPSDPKPRPTDVTYDQYCAGKNADKTYRVLLVVDYGTASSAPAGPVYSCYGFSDSVTGYRVLTQQHSERDNSGLICAIDGYPRSGCGDVVSSPAPKHSAKPTSSTRSTQQTASTAAPAAATTPTKATTTTSAATPRGVARTQHNATGTTATTAPPGSRRRIRPRRHRRCDPLPARRRPARRRSLGG